MCLRNVRIIFIFGIRILTNYLKRVFSCGAYFSCLMCNSPNVSWQSFKCKTEKGLGGFVIRFCNVRWPWKTFLNVWISNFKSSFIPFKIKYVFWRENLLYLNEFVIILNDASTPSYRVVFPEHNISRIQKIFHRYSGNEFIFD